MASSAFAAPKSGVYLGGDVDRYYELRDLFNLTDAGKTKFAADMSVTSFDKLIYVDFDGKGASLREIMNGEFSKVKRDLKKSDFEGVYTKSNLDGSNGATYDPRNDAIDGPTGDLKVDSVSAINKMQIKVVFGTKVDKDTATNVANYKLNGFSLNSSTTPATTDATAEVQEDGKTVIITAGTTGGFVGTTLVSNTGYVLSIDGVKNEDGSKTLEDFKSASFNYSDTEAPTVSKVEAKAVTSTKQVTVTFSEPVKGEGLYKINGKVATFTPGAASKTITLTSADSLVGNTTYTLEVLNEKDAEGNYINPNPSTKTFTVTIDATGDGVDKVEVQGDDTIRVSFKEDMNVTTVTQAGNIKLLNANLSDITGAGVNVAVTQVGTSKKQFDLKLSGTGAKALFNNTTKNFNGTLVFTNNLKDVSGNAIAAASQAVSLTLDEVAPTITKAEWYKPGTTFDGSSVGANGALVLTFSEDLVGAPTLTANTHFTAIKDDGQVEIVGDLVGAFKTGSKNVVKFTPQTAPFTSATNETVRLAGNIFTDESIGANQNTAVVLTVDVKNGATNGDTTKPVVSGVASGATKPNTIKVTMGEPVAALDNTTVTNPANYRIDGALVPEGTFVTTDAQAPNVITLNLPAESIDTNRNYSVTVTGIKDKAGNTADMYTQTISLQDDKKPVLTSGAFNQDNTLSLTFSESVKDLAVDDLVINLNDKATSLNGVYGVSNGTGADTGKAVVNFLTVADATYGDYIDVTPNGVFDGDDIRVADLHKARVTTTKTGTPVGTDANSNPLKTNVTITVTK